jgi:hypothetical protein
MASGLGTPLAGGFNGSGKPSNFYPGLTALMCWQYGTKLDTTTVTRISPRQDPATRRQAITVTGTGFLPLAGADMAEVGSRQLAAHCTSTTRCTVALPPMRAGTVSIRISAEDLTLSAAGSASHYRAVAAPSVSSISPASGPARGGTTVTIRGSNFINVTSVHFGRKLATRIRVISATRITVTVPPGTGTVTITVAAAGGTSKNTRPGRYHYN